MDLVQKGARAYVRHVLAATGWSATELARRSGLVPSTINRFLNSKSVTHTLSLRSLDKIRDASGIAMPNTLRTVSVDDEIAPSPGPLPQAAPVAVGQRDLPILGRAQGGGGGSLTIDAGGRPMDWFYRPAELVGVEGAFAVYALGASMAPRHEEGDLLFIHPGLPPRRGRSLVVVKHSDEALIKEFVRYTNTEIVLRQFNPPAEITLPLAEVRAVYRVVGTWEGR
jgi:phage repressor protein C with HTH and peptisase S24 domain